MYINKYRADRLCFAESKDSIWPCRSVETLTRALESHR